VGGGAAFGHDAHVDDAKPPRILLGNLEPIMLVGLCRVLAEEGMNVVGQEQALDQILGEAKRLQPDVIVLDLDSARGTSLTDAVRRAAPMAKLILWARDETLMEVLDPSSDARVVALAAPEELRSELTNSQ
jgi:AmiR/NasT family two-component response regulator